MIAVLDASASVDGHVAIEWDLVESGYAALDNIRVVPEPAGTMPLVAGLGLLAVVATGGRRRA